MGVIPTTGNRTFGATGAGRPLLVDRFVDVGQLVAFFVNGPEVGIAAHDQEFVGLVFHRHPRPQRNSGQQIGRQRIGKLFVVHIRVIFRMERFQDMRGRNIEIAFVHDVIHFQRLGCSKGEHDGIGVHHL